MSESESSLVLVENGHVGGGIEHVFIGGLNAEVKVGGFVSVEDVRDLAKLLAFPVKVRISKDGKGLGSRIVRGLEVNDGTVDGVGACEICISKIFGITNNDLVE